MAEVGVTQAVERLRKTMRGLSRNAISSTVRELMAEMLPDLDLLAARLATLERERDTAKAEADEYHMKLCLEIDRVKALEREREALRGYARHTPGVCESLLRRLDWTKGAYACTCGLSALLAPPAPAGGAAP